MRAVDLHSRELYRCHGLTGPQALILSVVAREGPLTAGELARRVSLSQASITDVVKRLESRGMLERLRADEDRRRVLVSVTESARLVLKTSPPLLQETFISRFHGLPVEERQSLTEALRRVADMMDAGSWDAAPILSGEPVVPQAEEHLPATATPGTGDPSGDQIQFLRRK